MVADHPDARATTYSIHSWDETQARALVSAAVHRKLAMVEHLSGYTRGHEDIEHDMLAHVRDAYHTYDPARGAFSTFVSTIVGRRMIDLQRKDTRRVVRETVYVGRRREVVQPDEILEPRDVVETIDAEIVGGDGQPTLTEWLAYVYAACKRQQRHYPGNLHKARRTFTAAQAVACGLLAAKLRYGKRAMVLLFETRADLREVVGFKDVPSDRWFWDAARAPQRAAG